MHVLRSSRPEPSDHAENAMHIPIQTETATFPQITVLHVRQSLSDRPLDVHARDASLPQHATVVVADMLWTQLCGNYPNRGPSHDRDSAFKPLQCRRSEDNALRPPRRQEVSYASMGPKTLPCERRLAQVSRT